MSARRIQSLRKLQRSVITALPEDRKLPTSYACKRHDWYRRSSGASYAHASRVDGQKFPKRSLWFEIEAMVSNCDIGFVREGQDVEFKVDTFCTQTASA
jgi:hypothetical protein